MCFYSYSAINILIIWWFQATNFVKPVEIFEHILKYGYYFVYVTSIAYLFRVQLITFISSKIVLIHFHTHFLAMFLLVVSHCDIWAFFLMFLSISQFTVTMDSTHKCNWIKSCFAIRLIFYIHKILHSLLKSQEIFLANYYFAQASLS